MVMEGPTPQCVGREFVRQYYTILNKAPCHLHRFYATNSSFMHGGENRNCETIVGQSDIHKYIQELNFKDCHAKILLIDSQSTMSDGVVIQVTGELSNNGRPMRRFMQTFVLAPQSEKKYFVHNDIFRYQDQVFNDDCDVGDDCSEEPLQDNGHVEELQQAQVSHEIVEPTPVTVAPPPGVPAPTVAPPVAAAPVVVEYVAPVVAAAPAVMPAAAPVAAPAPAVTIVAAAAPPAAVQHVQQVMSQQQQMPQQQHLNNGLVSNHQDLAPPAPVPTQQQNVAPPAHHPIHHQTPQSPPQPSVVPTHAQSSPHNPRQTDNGHVAPVIESREEAPQFMSEERNSWNDEDRTTSPPARPQQTTRPQQPQQQQSRPQQTKKAEQQQSAIQPATRSYAGFFKTTASPTTASMAQQPTPQHHSHHYANREINSAPGPQHQNSNQSNNSMAQQQAPQQHSREPRGEREVQSHPRDQPPREQRGDRGDSRNERGDGFQRAGRRAPMNNYRNNRSSNYSESDHTNNSEENGGDNSGGGYGGGRLEERRRPNSYPDSHQIFVGNVPQSMSDDDLRDLFQKYGPIVDVRINQGKGKLGPGNGKPPSAVPNFGFITFEDENAVQKCLNDKPITTITDHRLNVEEKKAKSKMGEGGNYNARPNMRPQMGGRNNYNNSRVEGGGGGGGRGGSRGGYGGGPARR